jgi:hypothetical protein
MAALTEKYGTAKKNALIKGYKIHEEQIRNIAREFRELYHARRPASLSAVRAGKKPEQKNRASRSAALPYIHKIVWKTSPLEGSVEENQYDLLPEMETPGRTVTAIRCTRCGIAFPVADFLYTKKSGLCIDCWEEMAI